MNIPEGLKYSKEHEWVKVEGNVATIGITDYAQQEFRAQMVDSTQVQVFNPFLQ